MTCPDAHYRQCRRVHQLQTAPRVGRLPISYVLMRRPLLVSIIFGASRCPTHIVAGSAVLIWCLMRFKRHRSLPMLASLWAAPDRSTVDLMRTFYEGLRSGLAKDEALRQAQIATIRKGGPGSLPLRWAGFQLFGDWK